MPNTRKKQVILGGNGNLGRHLQSALVARGHTVVVIDRSTQCKENGEHQSSAVKLFSHTLGIDDPTRLAQAIEGAETVFSVVTPDVQHGTEKQFEQTNHIGMKELVQACRIAGVPKIVQASSMAVTNHFVPSVNQNEDESLPPLESYKVAYDRTKRLGEDIILNANSDSLKTCALRIGGVLASPSDYHLRRYFENGRKFGTLYTTTAAKLDTICAQDVAMAMMKASEKLDSAPELLQGRALYVTKSRNDDAPSLTELAVHLAKLMNWKIKVVPLKVVSALRVGMRLHHYCLTKGTISQRRGCNDLRRATPAHVFWDISNYEQTFDNARARQILDWEPKLSWQEGLEAIVESYKESCHQAPTKQKWSRNRQRESGSIVQPQGISKIHLTVN